MTTTTKLIIRLLVTAGFSAKGVQSKIRKPDGTKYAISTIYWVIWAEGLGGRAAKFRNGESELAKKRIREALAPTRETIKFPHGITRKWEAHGLDPRTGRRMA